MESAWDTIERLTIDYKIQKMRNRGNRKPYYCVNKLMPERLLIDIVLGNKTNAQLAREYYMSPSHVSYYVGIFGGNKKFRKTGK